MESAAQFVCDDPEMAGRAGGVWAANHVLLFSLVACLVASAELYLAFGFGDRPPVKYITDVIFGLGWVIGGLLGTWLRPDSRLGQLMTVLGVVVFLNNPWGFGLPTAFPMRGLITVLGVVGFWATAAMGGTCYWPIHRAGYAPPPRGAWSWSHTSPPLPFRLRNSWC